MHTYLTHSHAKTQLQYHQLICAKNGLNLSYLCNCVVVVLGNLQSVDLVHFICVLIASSLSFSISSIFRHYRVTRKHAGGFTIDVDNPVSITTSGLD